MSFSNAFLYQHYFLSKEQKYKLLRSTLPTFRWKACRYSNSLIFVKKIRKWTEWLFFSAQEWREGSTRPTSGWEESHWVIFCPTPAVPAHGKDLATVFWKWSCVSDFFIFLTVLDPRIRNPELWIWIQEAKLNSTGQFCAIEKIHCQLDCQIDCQIFFWNVL